MLKFIDNFPLKNITTLSIGGPAKKFVAVTTQEELIEAIQYAKENNLPYLIIGGGSNLLVSDEGVDALIIKNEISSIATSGVGFPVPSGVEGDSPEVCVASGTPLQALVDYSIEQGLSGLQKLTGIPGTVGGAVYGNAGAYGQSISDHLISVQVLNPNNLTRFAREATPKAGEARRAIEQFNDLDSNFNYRDSEFKRNHYIILEATFQLQTGDPDALQKEAQDTLAKRLIKYPPGIKCPGSFFKNIVTSTLPKEILDKIPQDKIVYGKLPAGTLLEMVGANGQSSDGIQITSYHANLFINKGTGTAQAFYNLAKTYALKVKKKFNITLEPEVQLVNLPPLI